eukprot:1157243-Pelagomonas_calceolata.AAC.7
MYTHILESGAAPFVCAHTCSYRLCCSSLACAYMLTTSGMRTTIAAPPVCAHTCSYNFAAPP